MPTATSNPELAQKIAARLAALFIEQDSRTREDRVFGTADFFQAEVQKVADQLRLSEDKLRVLRQRYRYELPSEQETNLRTLDRLQVQKTGNIEALDRYVHPADEPRAADLGNIPGDLHRNRRKNRDRRAFKSPGRELPEEGTGI